MHNVLVVMEIIGHRLLEVRCNILESKRKLTIRKSVVRENESRLVLGFRANVNLIVTEEAIPKRKDLTTNTLIDDLIDK